MAILHALFRLGYNIYVSRTNQTEQNPVHPRLYAIILALTVAVAASLNGGLPGLSGVAQAQVTCFGASNRPGSGILLAWHVPAESAVVATHLSRSQSDGPYIPFADLAVVPPPPESTVDGDGLRFTTVDPNVAPGILYSYRLVITETVPTTTTHEHLETWRYDDSENAPQDEERCSQERTSATWTATPNSSQGSPSPTWTFIPTKTSTPPHTPTGTWTATPTRTATPTWTSTLPPYPTRTPVPFPTSTPSDTPTPVPPTPTESPTFTITPTPTPAISPPDSDDGSPPEEQQGDDGSQPQEEPTQTETPTSVPTASATTQSLIQAATATPTSTDPAPATRGEISGPDPAAEENPVSAEMGVAGGTENEPEQNRTALETLDPLSEYVPNRLPVNRRRYVRIVLFAVGSVAFLAAFAFVAAALALFPVRRE